MPDYLPEAPHLNTSCWGLGHQHRNLQIEGDTNNSVHCRYFCVFLEGGDNGDLAWQSVTLHENFKPVLILLVTTHLLEPLKTFLYNVVESPFSKQLGCSFLDSTHISYTLCFQTKMLKSLIHSYLLFILFSCSHLSLNEF